MPASPSTARAINDRLALRLLQQEGPLTAGQLKQLTGLSRPSVADLVERLAEAGLIGVVGESGEQRRGPNARLYGIVADRAHLAALDVRTEGVAVVVADLLGTVLAEASIPIGDGTATVPAVEQAVALVERTAAEAGVERLHTIGVGAPGLIDPATGELRNSSGLPEWHRRLVAALQERLPARVVVENETNLAALAEQREGAARDRDTFALLWFGHGIGAAVVLDGVLRRGASGGTGEIGFLPVPGTGGLPSATDCEGGFHSLAGAAAIAELAGRYGVVAPVPPHEPHAAALVRAAARATERPTTRPPGLPPTAAPAPGPGAASVPGPASASVPGPSSVPASASMSALISAPVPGRVSASGPVLGPGPVVSPASDSVSDPGPDSAVASAPGAASGPVPDPVSDPVVGPAPAPVRGPVPGRVSASGRAFGPGPDLSPASDSASGPGPGPALASVPDSVSDRAPDSAGASATAPAQGPAPVAVAGSASSSAPVAVSGAALGPGSVQGAGPGPGQGRAPAPHPAQEPPSDAASAFLDALADRVALGAASVVAVLDPGCVVLAGEVGGAGGDALAHRVQDRLARMTPLPTEVRAGTLGGGAVLRGALLMARDGAQDELFAPPGR